MVAGQAVRAVSDRLRRHRLHHHHHHAADATAHIVENPYAHFLRGQEIAITFVLIALLGAVFLKGFGEYRYRRCAGGRLYRAEPGGCRHRLYADCPEPSVLTNWKSALLSSYSNPFLMIGAAITGVPRLALGLSGFETGVVVMPLVKGDADDAGKAVGAHQEHAQAADHGGFDHERAADDCSLVTTVLIPQQEFRPATHAQHRNSFRSSWWGKRTKGAVVIANDLALFPAGRVITKNDVTAAQVLGQLPALATAAGVDPGRGSQGGRGERTMPWRIWPTSTSALDSARFMTSARS